jgi:hypothetical protein
MKYSITLSVFCIVIAGCQKSELPAIPEIARFSATPLIENGTYYNQKTRLGITPEQEIKAPFITPIDEIIGFVILGASNSNAEGEVIISNISGDASVRSELIIKNCAVGAADINNWLDLSDPCWDNAMAALGYLAPEEVQIIWFKTDDLLSPVKTFPEESLELKNKLIEFITLLKSVFPNLKQVYGSGRSYTGFSEPSQHQEPSGYHTGWAWAWLVEDQINGVLPADFPWVSDEIYLWTNGEEMREDGYQILRTDFYADGVHLNEIGKKKVADHIIYKLKTMPSSSGWFLE